MPLCHLQRDIRVCRRRGNGDLLGLPLLLVFQVVVIIKIIPGGIRRLAHQKRPGGEPAHQGKAHQKDPQSGPAAVAAAPPGTLFPVLFHTAPWHGAAIALHHLPGALAVLLHHLCRDHILPAGSLKLLHASLIPYATRRRMWSLRSRWSRRFFPYAAPKWS